MHNMGKDYIKQVVSASALKFLQAITNRWFGRQRSGWSGRESGEGYFYLSKCESTSRHFLHWEGVIDVKIEELSWSWSVPGAGSFSWDSFSPHCCHWPSATSTIARSPSSCIVSLDIADSPSLDIPHCRLHSIPPSLGCITYFECFLAMEQVSEFHSMHIDHNFTMNGRQYDWGY